MNLPHVEGDMYWKVMEGQQSYHNAPQLLKKEVKPLFPGVSAFSNPDNSISVITMVQETANDMSTWSDQVESERETLTEQFVGLAKEVCGR